MCTVHRYGSPRDRRGFRCRGNAEHTQRQKSQPLLNHYRHIPYQSVLAYSVRFGFIRWNIITIDVFLLLTISGILGVWGIRQRHKTYEGVIDSDPHAVFAFLLLLVHLPSPVSPCSCTTRTTLRCRRSATLYLHSSWFRGHHSSLISSQILAACFRRTWQVYKVMYSPTSMPFFTFRFAGLIATLAVVVLQCMAGTRAQRNEWFL